MHNPQQVALLHAMVLKVLCTLLLLIGALLQKHMQECYDTLCVCSYRPEASGYLLSPASLDRSNLCLKVTEAISFEVVSYFEIKIGVRYEFVAT